MDQEVFITTEDLGQLMSQNQRVYILDGTILLTASAKDAFLAKRIPGARFFDQMEIRDKTASHPLAYPSAENFAKEMMTLRVPNDGGLVVVYDQEGMRAAPRAWFLLRYFGYPRVKFLSGGLPKWVSEGRPTITGPLAPISGISLNPQDYHCTEHPELITRFEQIQAIVHSTPSSTVIWDPRHPSFTSGTLIPHSQNIFYQHLLNSDFTPKPPDAIRQELLRSGLDLTKPTVVTCNRGLMACCGVLLLTHAGKKDVRLNPGSWFEWSHRAKL